MTDADHNAGVLKAPKTAFLTLLTFLIAITTAVLLIVFAKITALVFPYLISDAGLNQKYAVFLWYLGNTVVVVLVLRLYASWHFEERGSR